MKSQIYFKIKNEKSYDTIRFTGGSLSLKDLKTKIKEKLQDKNQGIGKEKDKEKAKDDILVYDELTKNLIPDDSTLIAADRKVVIERSSAIPTLGPAGYRSSYPSGIKADKSEFMCNLCKNQFVNPTLTRCCGGTACETCIDKNIKLKSECPFCHKKALGSIKAGPNVKLQEMIQKMSTSMPPAVLPMAHAYGSQPVNPNVAMNLVPFKEIDKYLNGAKYFIIKSSNFENIQLSIKHSEWATTKANETKLNNAFQRSKNVILIFSVNKSSQFQGYARMESLSTNRAASWQVQDSIKLGGSFKILWLRVCNVNFSRVSQMKNKFNNGEPIKKSRDTQEIPEDIGFQICNMFELPDKDSTAMHYPTSSDRPKYMYQYGQAPTPMGYQNPVYTAASSPRDMRDFKVLSDSVSPSEAKSPMSKPGSDDFQSNIEKEDFYPSIQEEEQKKDEPEIDLLADLDFDEPTNFEPTAPVAQAEIEVEDDLPLEHAVANMEEILEMAEGEVSVLDEQEIEPIEQQHDIIEEKVVPQSETKESIPQAQEQEHDHDQDDFLHNFEPEDEEEDFNNEKAKEESRSRSRESEQKQQFIEEEEERDYQGGNQEDDRPQPPPPKAQYEEQRRVSPPRSPSADKQEEKKKPKPPAVDMNKFPPAPSMPYDAASMMRPDSYMARPPPMVDHRPPPPNMMYPSAPQSMRYPYNNYPSAYPNQPYGSYPMAPYPGMDQRMQMGMNPNYPYQYYNYPGMWGGPGGRPFPMDSRGKLDGNDDNGDNQSEGSEESEGSRKREKKKHKKEKKKKRSKDRERDRERERSRDKSREREKSNVREKGRSRDRSRNKSKSKSRRK